MSTNSKPRVRKTDDMLTATFDRSWYERYTAKMKKNGNKEKESGNRKKNRTDELRKSSRKSESSTRSSQTDSSSKKTKSTRSSQTSENSTNSSKSGKTFSSKSNGNYRDKRRDIKTGHITDAMSKDQDCEITMRRINGINKYIRCKLGDDIFPRRRNVQKKARKPSKSISSSSSEDSLSKKFDHNGLPLSHPLAITPFPGATSARQKEKARRLLKEAMENGLLDQVANPPSSKNESKKETESPSSEIYTHPLKNSKSGGKIIHFPNECSVETRKKGRDALKLLAQKQKNDEEILKKKDRTVTKSQSTSSIPIKAIESEIRHERRFCHDCGACKQCAKICMDRHHNVSDRDRENFKRDIKQLRKKIQNPESKRHKRTKSPFDVTQSVSEHNLEKSEKIEKRGKSSKKNKRTGKSNKGRRPK